MFTQNLRKMLTGIHNVNRPLTKCVIRVIELWYDSWCAVIRVIRQISYI